MERGKVKCHKYWPKKAEEVQYWGAFQVKNTGETITEDHFIRQKLELSYEGQTRTVYHFKFTQVNPHFTSIYPHFTLYSALFTPNSPSNELNLPSIHPLSPQFTKWIYPHLTFYS